MTPPQTVDFTVAGSGLFPFDMLRYDRCWPRTESDSFVVEATTRRGSPGIIEVGMRGLSDPTKARWASFQWVVLSVAGRSVE